MDFWNLMVKKDDLICGFINKIFRIKNLLDLNKQRLLRQMPKTLGNNSNLFIILNSPSIKNQDLSVLKGQDILFVNRGFMHPLYKELQPCYHVFVDPKMLNGEWSINWLDDIVSLVPNITFVMPVSWASNEIIRPFINKNYSFYWIKDDDKLTCLGVGGSSIKFAIQRGYKNIFFTGFEATGIAYELISGASHFYGVNDENLNKTTKDYVMDLLMHSRHLHDLNVLADYCRNKQVSVVNMTVGGLLDMFPRKNIVDCI